jgi:glycosyltransferase involved in cell wall biosynthesis
LAARLFKSVTKVPVVSHHHHLEDRALDRFLTKTLVLASDKVITVSKYSQRQLVETYRLQPGKVAVVYNGVAEEYRPLPQNRNRKPDVIELLYLGSLKPRKNLRFLLDVLAKVSSQDTRVMLTIGGQGPQKDELEAYALQLGLGDSVVFPGYIPEDEKVSCYNRADVFVLPSLLEGFGMVVTEAMACGKPVVASNVCSLPELVDDGETGYLADPYQVDSFADRILRLVRDRDMREQMGIRGRKRVLRQFSWERAAKRVTQVYEQAIAEVTGA